MDVCRLQRTLELIAVNGAESAGAQEQRCGNADHLRVPKRRILLGKRHVLALLVSSCATPSFGMKHERKEAQRLRFLRQHLGHEPAQEQSLLGKIATGDVGPTWVSPAL